MSGRLGIVLVVCTSYSIFTSDAYTQPASGTDSSASGGAAAVLRQFLDETQTYQAEFEQALVAADGQEVERAMGELSIARPGRFAWRYLAPLDQLVVADGVNLWIYDVELSQATVTPLAEAARATPAMLLSGDATLDEEFTIQDSFEADQLSWVRLEPRPSGGDFKEILIGFDGVTLRRMQLRDSLDQITSLEFWNVEVNAEIAAAVFEFVPPPGVDVIGEVH